MVTTPVWKKNGTPLHGGYFGHLLKLALVKNGAFEAVYGQGQHRLNLRMALSVSFLPISTEQKLFVLRSYIALKGVSLRQYDSRR